MFIFCSFLVIIALISANLNLISVLNDTNFKAWNENMEIILSCMNFDFALRLEQALSPSKSSTSKQRKIMRSGIAPIA